MDPTRIVLAGCWTALMLIYLLGDLLRLFAGDHVPGELDGRPARAPLLRQSRNLWQVSRSPSERAIARSPGGDGGGARAAGGTAPDAASSWMWTVAALIMLVPIAMIVASLLVPMGPLRWATIAIAIAIALFNLAGLPYPGFYDNMLIAVSFLLNGLIVWQAWTWSAPTG